MRVEVLDGAERRRRWTDERKLSILMEVGLRGATVTDVARRHALSRQQLYTWRRELRRHGALRLPGPAEGHPVFVPVAPPLPPASAPLAPAPQEPVPASARAAQPEEDVSEASAEPTIEIALANGRRLRVSPGVDDATLARLIRLVEAA
jgi:transposase